MGIESLLKLGIKSLPETAKFKNPQAAANALAKKGVKPEELEYANLQLPETGITKQDLVAAEQGRADWFKVKEVDEGYQGYSLPAAENNPTYKEKILTFRERSAAEQADPESRVARARAENQGGSRFTSSHFPETKNYLAHTRIYDDSLDGVPTRVLQEIQSDLHQQGRQLGYIDENNVDTIFQKVKSIVGDIPGFGEGSFEAQDLQDIPYYLRSNGADETAKEVEGVLAEMKNSNVPRSPFEKTWLRKSIERELNDAINEGRKQLAIPISGDLDSLVRGKGVQKWYETQVLETAKKVAKATNSTFELKTTGKHTEAPVLTEQNIADIKELLLDKFSFTDRIETVNNYVRQNVENGVNILPETGGSIEYYIFNHIVGDADSLAKMNKSIADSLPNDQITYAVIKPKGPISTTLYSTPAAAGFGAYIAYRDGRSQEEVEGYLREQGFDDEDLATINSIVDSAANAEANGVSPEEIQKFLMSKDTVADTTETNNASRVPGTAETPWSDVPDEIPTDPKGDAQVKLTDPEETNLQTFIANAKVLHPVKVSDLLTTIPAWFGNQAAIRRYDAARESSRVKIIEMAQRHGVSLEWDPNGVGSDKWYTLKDGQYIEVDESFWEEVKAMSGELVGGIAGGITAAYVSKGKISATTAGAVGGALLGSQIDYLRAATELQEEMEAESAIYRGMNATEAGIVGEVLGFALVKTVKGGWNTIVRAKDYILNGDTTAARRALRENLNISEEQIDEMVTQLDRVATQSGTTAEQGIAATALTQQGAQDLVSLGAVVDPKITRIVTQQIDARAKDVLKTTGELSGEQVPRQFIKDLQNYTADVKGFYRDVKIQAAQSPLSPLFTWDYKKLAIDPILEGIGKELGVTKDIVTDPTINKYLAQSQKIKALSEKTSFADLIELRQLVNEFLYNKGVAKTSNAAKLRTVLNNIDQSIEQGAQAVLEQPDEWLSNWYKARQQYTQMKDVEKTALYRMIFDQKGKLKPVQPENVVKAMSKYITALDGSFDEVMGKIPLAGRSKYEGAVVDYLTTKFTAGSEQGIQAINFPMLAKELNSISLTTKEARAARSAINEFAEVFKNDVNLAKMTSNIHIPQTMQGLTANLVSKAQFELASSTWGKIKQTLPTEMGRNYSLAKKVAELLNKPLDVKLTKELMAEADTKMVEAIKALQENVIRMNAKDAAASQVRLYGEGTVLKITGEGVPANKIPMHRIATLDDVKTVADAEAVTMDSVMLDKFLKDYGYKAVVQGSDRVRILK